MERRSAAKRRHVYADLNSADATSTLPISPAASSFIPTPSHTLRNSPQERPANLTIPPAYRQPFNRKPEPGEEERGAFGVTIRNGRKWTRQFTAGFRDAVRLSSSVNIVSSDAELRAQVLKSSLINLICLLSIFIFDVLVYPAIHPSHLSSAASSKAHHVKAFFDLFWKWPIFAFCFWINAYWSASISKRALVVQYPTSRQAQPEPNVGNSNIYQKVLASLPRFLLILDYQVTALFLSYIPIIGKPLAFCYACLLNSYYCFDFSFSTRGWNLRTVTKHMRQKIPYFLGFGLAPSLLCGFGPLLLNMAIFALIYPLLVIQALQARAVPALSLEDAATSLPMSPFPTGVPVTPFLSRQGSPLGTPITTSSGLPPLSPQNGYADLSQNHVAPNESSDMIAARLRALGQDGLLDDDEGYKPNGYQSYSSTRAQGTWQSTLRRYITLLTRLIRRWPLFWLATSTQDTARWFVLGIERRMGRSGSMFLPSELSTPRRGSLRTGGAGVYGNGWAGKRRKSSYR